MKQVEKFLPIAIIIVAAVGLRLIPHMPNFAPIGAMALFGGAYLDKRLAIALPLVAMLLSDLFIGFYSPVVMISVYGSFVLVGLIGMQLRKRKNPKNILLAAVGSSALFFLITNFSVWAAGSYGRGFEGLITSYVMAIPFFRGTLMGDLFYTTLFFGGFDLIKSLSINRNLALNFSKQPNP